MIKRIFYFITAIISISLLISCQESDNEPVGKGQVGFTFQAIAGEGGRIAAVADESEPAYLKFMLTNAQGDEVTETVAVHKFGNHYATQQLVLESDTYSLDEFLVLNKAQEVVYAAPLEGSELAEYVIAPLPFSFSVGVEETVDVALQVLSIDEHNPSAFGYTTFDFLVLTLEEFHIFGSPLVEVSTGEFDFVLTVEARDTTKSLTWSKSWEIMNASTISIPIGYDQYTVTASANGYISQSKYYKTGIEYSDLKRLKAIGLDEIRFELIQEGSGIVEMMGDDHGNKFYVSTDPCVLWGRLEMSMENALRVDYIHVDQLALLRENYEERERVGQNMWNVIDYPMIMTNVNNIYDWLDYYDEAVNFCETDLDEAYRERQEEVVFEKAIMLEYDLDHEEFPVAVSDYDVVFIHVYE